MKTIIFNEILSAVEQATEIDRALILSRSKQPDVVEARSLLFHYLYAVSSQVTHFDDRKQYGGNILAIMMNHIDSKLKTR